MADEPGQTTRRTAAPRYRAGVCVAAGLPVIPARFVMFVFVVIEVSLLPKWPARGAGDGREYTQTTLQCQALFSRKDFFRIFCRRDASRVAAGRGLNRGRRARLSRRELKGDTRGRVRR
jgi:hypothetical protein